MPPTFTPIPSPPNAPTELKTVSKPQFVELTWKDNANDEQGYRVYRSSDGGTTWQQIGNNLAANTVKFQDRAGPIRGATLTYYVVAFNAEGESPRSNLSSVAR